MTAAARGGEAVAISSLRGRRLPVIASPTPSRHCEAEGRGNLMTTGYSQD